MWTNAMLVSVTYAETFWRCRVWLMQTALWRQSKQASHGLFSFEGKQQGSSAPKTVLKRPSLTLVDQCTDCPYLFRPNTKYYVLFLIHVMNALISQFSATKCKILGLPGWVVCSWKKDHQNTPPGYWPLFCWKWCCWLPEDFPSSGKSLFKGLLSLKEVLTLLAISQGLL